MTNPETRVAKGRASANQHELAINIMRVLDHRQKKQKTKKKAKQDKTKP